jgi:hypothetical protein
VQEHTSLAQRLPLPAASELLAEEDGDRVAAAAAGEMDAPSPRPLAGASLQV